MLASCSWPQARYGPEQTGFNPFETSLSATNIPRLQLRWSQPVDGGATPAIANGALYVGSGKLHVFDASTGSARWSSREIGASRSAPAVAKGAVYVSGAKVYAFDATTGAELWSAGTGAGRGSPTVAKGVVYVSADKLYAFDAARGALLWSAATGVGSGSPAVANGVVYVSADKLYAFDAARGALLWSAATGVGGGSPAVAKGVVYVSADKLYAFDAARGALLWSAATGVGGGSPAVAKGVVYVSADKLFAFTAVTGARLWSAPTGGGGGSPAVANGVVYVENQSTVAVPDVWAFDATTGTQRWSSWAGGFAPVPNAHPVVANGVLYFGRYWLNAYSLPIATPQLSISPALPDDFNLSEDVLGEAFWITNTGSMPTSPIAARLAGPDAAQFRLNSGECAGARLAAGASCTMLVAFAPTQSGPLRAQLTATAAAGGTVNALLGGTAPPFLVSPRSQGFSAYPGSTSTASFTVTNLGVAPLGPITNSVTASSGFRIAADACTGRIIAVGAGCTVAVQFAPTAARSYEGQLVTGAGGHQSVVPLGGGGLAQLAASPIPANGTADFGSVRVGGTRSLSFTITNVSPNPAGPFTETIEHPNGFSITSDTCAGNVMAAGSDCTVVVTFAPADTESSFFGILHVDAPSDGLKLGLGGTGT